MWWGHELSWAWMMFGGLMMLLFWGGFFALVVLVLRAFSGSRQLAGSAAPPTLTSNTALEILKERYARGEIGKAEYEEMRDDLKTE